MVDVVLLLFELVPYRIYRLCAAFYLIFEPCRVELFSDGLYEFGYVLVTLYLRFVKLVGYVGVGLAVGVFQRQILEFRLYCIESESMGERRIEVIGLVGDIVYHLLVGMVVDCAHKGKSVDNHYYDDANVFGKCQQKLSEVVAFNSCLLAVECRHFQQSAY